MIILLNGLIIPHPETGCSGEGGATELYWIDSNDNTLCRQLCYTVPLGSCKCANPFQRAGNLKLSMEMINLRKLVY